MSKIISDNIEYSLAHLNPLELTFYSNRLEKNIIVRSVFSDHCYSEHVSSKQDVHKNCKECKLPSALKIRNDRCFCLKRYNLSLQLPKIIKDLLFNERAKVRVTSARRNWSFVVDINLLKKINSNFDLIKDYYIFFEIKKNRSEHHQDLNLNIESAYLPKKKPYLYKKMNFFLLCSKIYREEKINFF